MAGRLGVVTVSYSRGKVQLPWASRDLLLQEINHLDSAHATIDAFQAVGASQPVELRRSDKELLIEAINVWSHNVTVDGLPDGVWDLRCSLVDDLHDGDQRANRN